MLSQILSGELKLKLHTGCGLWPLLLLIHKRWILQ
jgi:hypothetical protein